MNEYIKTKLKSYIDKHFISHMNEHGGIYIAGGALTSLATNSDINDIDCYFPNKEALVSAIRYMQDDGVWCCFISDKSIIYVRDKTIYQFIYYDFYEKAEDIFEDYDFTINMCAYDSKKDVIVADKGFLLHNSQRYLKFNYKTKFPIISALRIKKYEERGYKIPRKEFVKIMLAINSLNINSWEDFKSHCGNLYGLNYVKDSMIKDKEFSLENALKVIDDAKFEGKSEAEYRIDPRVVDVVIEGKSIKYIGSDTDIILIDDFEYPEQIVDLILNGNIKSEEVAIEDYLGEYLYKWVDKDLRSHYDNNFQYVLHEEVCAKSCYIKRKPTLWMVTKGNLQKATYRNRGVVLKCKYDVKDIVDIGSGGYQDH